MVVEDLDARGRAVGRAGPHPVRLAHGVPGDVVRARVRKRRRGRLHADVLERLASGPDRVPAVCAHFGTCGGCAFQDLAYPAQLEWKRRRLQAALERAGIEAQVEAPIPSEELTGYRNKMDFTFGARRWIESHEPPGAERDFALGLHVPGVWSKVLDIERCEIAFPAARAILSSARRLARARGLAPFDPARGEGLLRHLVLRHAPTTGDVLVELITSPCADAEVEALMQELCAEHPEITTAVHGITARRAQVALAERERVLLGSGVLRERVAGLELEISAGAFFQVNTRAAERLVELVRAGARPRPDDVVWDLYSGGGLLALALARSCRAVRGIELVEAAVRDARANAARNGIDNATFEAGDMAELLQAEAAEPPAVCVVDPPRAGVHPKVTPALCALAPARIVWVSCHLESAAPDLARLARSGWTVERVQPLDLFPHTPHVECVLVLERGA